MTSNPSTSQSVITMPLGWRIFGAACLLAIPFELVWLWDANSGYIGKLMTLIIVIVSLVGGVDLLSFRLILDDKQMSLRRWPRGGFVRSYSDILDIRLRGQRATILIFKPDSRKVDHRASGGQVRAEIPAFAITPTTLSALLKQKISGVAG
jgi:hypothetical protein